jgi:hypothetical protein
VTSSTSACAGSRPGVEIESDPREYGYSPRHCAGFFYDPDGIKLEIVHIPWPPLAAKQLRLKPVAVPAEVQGSQLLRCLADQVALMAMFP